MREEKGCSALQSIEKRVIKQIIRDSEKSADASVKTAFVEAE